MTYLRRDNPRTEHPSSFAPEEVLLRISLLHRDAGFLNQWYEAVVGYRPQEDDPTMSFTDLEALCLEVQAEHLKHQNKGE